MQHCNNIHLFTLRTKSWRYDRNQRRIPPHPSLPQQGDEGPCPMCTGTEDIHCVTLNLLSVLMYISLMLCVAHSSLHSAEEWKEEEVINSLILTISSSYYFCCPACSSCSWGQDIQSACGREPSESPSSSLFGFLEQVLALYMDSLMGHVWKAWTDLHKIYMKGIRVVVYSYGPVPLLQKGLTGRFVIAFPLSCTLAMTKLCNNIFLLLNL